MKYRSTKAYFDNIESLIEEGIKYRKQEKIGSVFSTEYNILYSLYRHPDKRIKNKFVVFKMNLDNFEYNHNIVKINEPLDDLYRIHNFIIKDFLKSGKKYMRI